MAKMSLEDLRKLRDIKKTDINKRETEGKEIKIIIGMGTCGIAAGAKRTFDAFISALEKEHISNALVKQTGCMGLCYVEPTVEIHMPGMPDIIYGKVDENVAQTIVSRHILRSVLVSDHIFDKPAADIIKD